MYPLARGNVVRATAALRGLRPASRAVAGTFRTPGSRSAASNLGTAVMPPADDAPRRALAGWEERPYSAPPRNLNLKSKFAGGWLFMMRPRLCKIE